MPTDLDTASARKRAEQAEAQVENTIMLLCLIFCLVMFVLVFKISGQECGRGSVEIIYYD